MYLYIHIYVIYVWEIYWGLIEKVVKYYLEVFEKSFQSFFKKLHF